jgi:copper transport protein
VQISAAFAHASLVRSEPPDGAVLAAAPQQVLLTFNEPVSLISAQVLDANGQNIVQPEAATTGDAELRIAIPADLGNGSYVASYRVVSLDGHPVAGSIVFSVGHDRAGIGTLRDSTSENAWRPFWTVLRAIVNAGVLGAAGGVLFLFLVLRSERTSSAAAIPFRFALIGVAAGLLSVGVQGGMLAGGSLAGIFDPATWRIGISSTFGRSTLMAVVGLTAIAVGLRVRGALGRVVSAAGTALALMNFAFAGHVVTAGPRWITVPALLLHTTAVAYWLGSLLPLRVTLREEGAAAKVRRFSSLAVPAVAILAAAGLVIAVLQVRTFVAVVTTTYGWTLLAKLGLVVCLLSIAAFNKIRPTPKLAAGEASAARAMRCTIAAECVFALAILVATVALGTTPPPRALQPTDTEAAALTVQGRTLIGEVSLSPAQIGPVDVSIILRNSVGAIVGAKEMDVSLSRPDVGVEPIQREAQLASEGSWAVQDLVIPLAGLWNLRLQVLISDFDREVLEGTFEIPDPAHATSHHEHH